MSSSRMNKVFATFRFALIAAVVWTLVLAVSFFSNLDRARDQAMEMAIAEARTNLNKDLAFRRWGTHHGGVYVPITETQPSVPWLSHVPERDVTTADGRQLTLLNPASMLRQVMDSYAEEYGIRGRITGLKYLNPGNAPDPWEKVQLEAFTRGEKKEVWAISSLDGAPHLRYMRAMFMEPGCVKCHAILGYRDGDMRGAIGVSLPLAPYYQNIDETRFNLAWSHGAIGFLGLLGIAWAGRQARRHERERERKEAKIQRLTQLYAALSQCNQAIVRSASEAELLPKICRDAVQFGGMKMAWIGMLDAASREVAPVASYGEGLEYLEGVRISVDAGLDPVATAIREMRPVWHQDFLHDPLTAPWHESAAPFGWSAVAALPLRRNSEVIGAFCLYAGETDAFDDDVRSLLWEMAADISYALDSFDREADRKQAVGALRESERRYRGMFDNSPDAVLLISLDGYVRDANPMACQLYGYDLNEFVGKHGSEFVHPDHAWRFAGALATIEAGRNFTDESVDVRKDGAPFPIEVYVSPFVYAGERVMLCSIRDITARKQADAKLRLAAEVFEQGREGIMITDTQGNIVLVNHAFSAISGYSEAEALGGSTRMLSSGRHDKAFYRAMWEAINTQGHWQGEVWNRRKDGGIYPEWLAISRVLDESGKPSHYIGIFNDISRHKADEERIQRLAHFDVLTGLPNRALLNDQSRHAISMSQRSGEPLAVLFADLDHFKNINDTLGHRVGDELLIEVAKRMKSMVRDEDTVSRQGGDEFILVLPGADADGAAHVAGKLLESVAQPYQIDQHELIVTASIGIAIYPGDGEDFDALSQCADVAMYRAKQEGRNNFRFFTPEMQVRSSRTLQLENALRHALARNELQLHYQPQVAMKDWRIIGVEALLRWRHPELGEISPAEFIPIAEGSGQILPIGEWVLRTAARQMRAWIDSGLEPMSIAVNLSAIQFRHANLPQMVTQILDEVRLPPQYLELELTEGVAMDNPLAAIAVMDDLHGRGIRMSIDDFGTGYSSLNYLKRFQVYKLKIDQSFVRDITTDPEDRAIVGAIISLANSLGLQTIAEGVETEGQLVYLRERGCGEAQGYYFSKPLPAEEFEAFVRQRMADGAA